MTLQLHEADVSRGPNPVVAAATEYYAQHPDILFLGSLGRAAVMDTGYGAHRPNGTLRDLDVVRFGIRPTSGDTQGGVEIDYSLENWIASDGSALVFPYKQSISVPVHPDAFMPYQGRVNGVTVPVPHPQVFGRIHAMKSVQRPKDVVSAKVYNAYLTEADFEPIHPELLAPFDEFRGILDKQFSYQLYGRARNAYYGIVSESFRKRMRVSRVVGKIQGI